MVSAPKLKKVIRDNHYTQKEVAKWIGITPTAFTNKLYRGSFRSEEIEAMLHLLDFGSPEYFIEVFFSSFDTVEQKD